MSIGLGDMKPEVMYRIEGRLRMSPKAQSNKLKEKRAQVDGMWSYEIYVGTQARVECAPGVTSLGNGNKINTIFDWWSWFVNTGKCFCGETSRINMKQTLKRLLWAHSTLAPSHSSRDKRLRRSNGGKSSP